MSVNAKLFVATSASNLQPIMVKVIEVLNVFNRSELDKEVERRGLNNRMQLTMKDNTWSNGVDVQTYNFNYFNIHFGIGENRRIFVTNICNSDYKRIYDGEKIIFDLNVWGKYDEIMKVIAEPLKEFGRVFYDFNDCDEFDFVEL